jgi:hypothetical protein
MVYVTFNLTPHASPRESWRFLLLPFASFCFLLLPLLPFASFLLPFCFLLRPFASFCFLRFLTLPCHGHRKTVGSGGGELRTLSRII